MPAIARSDSKDSVFSPNGTGYQCQAPMTTKTGTAIQDKVFSQGDLIVVKGEIVNPHNLPGCSTIDVQALSTHSSRVSAMGKMIGRIGDMYGDNTIISGSPRVFSN
jgi:hypothetical protein